jgi:hypothetical protein
VQRPLPWKPIAIATTALSVVLALLLLPACCCRGRAAGPAVTPEKVNPPLIGTQDIPTPTEAQAKEPVQAEMHNVWFHIDPVAYMDIHQLRGEMVSKDAGKPVNFDDKTSFIMTVDTARVGMKSPSLDILMNQYIFNYAGTPLKGLHVTPEGKQLKQEGVVHKILDIPFTMWADVSASNGKIRIHPTKMDICGLNGLLLLKAVGMTLEKMIGKQLPADKGVSAEGNDLLMDPNKMLPPPKIVLSLVDVKIEGDELMQIFDAGKHLAPLQPPHPEEKNWMYYRHGTLRMGKLLMIDADMEVTDTDDTDPFDFLIDKYNDQLVAGWERNTPSYGLYVFMRDWSDLGSPPKAGERMSVK